MKSLSGLSPGIFGRSAAILTMAFALLLTGFATSYAGTHSTISATAKSSPTGYSKNLKAASPTVGRAFVPDRPSTPAPDRSTSFTGYATRASSETPVQLRSGLAAPIAYPSSSSESSTTSIFRSSRTTPASLSDGFSSSGISRTVLPCSDANRPRSSLSFELSPAIGSRTSPIDKRSPSFRRPPSEFATGPTSALLPRLRSRSPGWSPRWTLARRSFARNSTASCFVSRWHSRRSRDSTNWNRANLPKSFTSRR
jgi:hypothetical protein